MPFVLRNAKACRGESGIPVCGDVPFAHHQRENEIPSRQSSRWIAARCVRRRSFGKRSEHCSLSDGELARTFSEEITTRSFDTEYAITEINRVEIELKYLILRERALHQLRHSHLDQFFWKRAVFVLADDEAVARGLHGDRAESFADAEGLHVTKCGAHESMPVHSAMLVKSSVFGSDERLPDVNRNLRDWYIHATDDRESSHESPGSIEDSTALVGMIGLNLAWTGTALETAGAQPHIEGEHTDDRDYKRNLENRLATNPDLLLPVF